MNIKSSRILIISFVFLALLLPPSFSAIDTENQSCSFKNPILDWESLPSVRTGVRIWSHTSKNPLNFTVMDWTNYTLKDEGGYEQAFCKGKPGMLVEAWYDPTYQLGNLKLFLDSSNRPTYDRPMLDYFEGRSYPFWLWYHRDNMLWAFPCLPFDSLFKAVIQGQPKWYQYTLDVYRENRFSEAVTPLESEMVQKKIDEPVGTFPGVNTGNKIESSTPDIAPKKAAILLEVNKPGVIRSIQIEPSSTQSAILDKITIRITTDGEITAELPFPLFFGSYFKAVINKAKGMPAGFDGKNLYNYFPMPFWQSIKIEIINNLENPAKLSSRIGWSDTNSYPRDSTGTFMVQYNKTMLLKAGEPSFTNLQVRGSGSLVGCVSELTGNIEGNFTIYTDDSDTPIVETTGGEDYFFHSYGLHDGFGTSFSGGLSARNEKNNAFGEGYRFHIIDYIPFLSSLKFTQDHAAYFAHDRDGIFQSAVYYYLNKKSFLVQTDYLDVGKEDSEKDHNYEIIGSTGRGRLQSDSGTYENDYALPINDEGRWTDQQTSFTASINPNNDGVRIRKRINQTAYHQEIEVFVDNVSAGIWFEQGSNYIDNYGLKKYSDIIREKYANLGQVVPTWQNEKISAIFRDTIFDLPAKLTAGKRTLNLRFQTIKSLSVKSADIGLTNEYVYWISCYNKTD